MPNVSTIDDVIDRCQKVMAHAWMVRTFVKHSEEIDEYPDLQGIVRTVFDAARALETQAHDPASYFKMLTKKLSRLRKANEEFAVQVKTASEHTNFKQAVISMKACVEELGYLLELSKRLEAEGCRLKEGDHQMLKPDPSREIHSLTPDS